MGSWSWSDPAGGGSCSCGLLNYFPVDELGKVKPRAWELCSVSGGFILKPKRTRGGESSTHVVLPTMTHTAGSASFHKSHKSQGPVMTFTLSSRHVHALPLSAAPESQQKPPADSSLPSPAVSFGSVGMKWALCGVPNKHASCCPFMVGLNAERTVCKSACTDECCQVKHLAWRSKDMWENRGSKSC